VTGALVSDVIHLRAAVPSHRVRSHAAGACPIIYDVSGLRSDSAVHHGASASSAVDQVDVAVGPHNHGDDMDHLTRVMVRVSGSPDPSDFRQSEEQAHMLGSMRQL
jgi:hypothetical protein